TDDQGELYLSTDDTPSNKERIAFVPTWVGSRQWDDTRDPANAAQKSVAQHLEAGRRYYIEALQVEGGGGDNIAVGWQLPDGTFERPIPGNRLSHWQNSTNPPSITGQPTNTTVAERETAILRLAATGAEPLTFLWFQNGLALSGEMSSSIVLPDLATNYDGYQYQCIVSNYQGSVTSQVAVLRVRPETIPPVVAQLNPPAGATVRYLAQVEVTFSEPVMGVGAADLLVNGQPATNVTGILAGPYVFQFAPAPNGAVHLSWSASHGITDRAGIPNPFAGGSWTNMVNPFAGPGDVVINEILAANQYGLLDEEGDNEDWIELCNRGSTSVNLAGWSLSDDPADPGQWVFPSRSLPPGGFLLVFASAKDRKPGGTNYLHTSFKLRPDGEYLGLFSAESPRSPVSELSPEFPEQRNDYSWGLDASGALRYFSPPTPGESNGTSSIEGVCAPVHFSVERGYFAAPFNVILSTATAGAAMRYTTNGADPTEATGLLYTNALRLTATTSLRAAAFKANLLPSKINTQTYFYNLTTAQRSLPALSLVTDQNNITGPSGIAGISGGSYANGFWEAVNPGDYYNPIKKGIAWERPVSIEFVQPDNSGFSALCGIRIHASDYFRPRLHSDSKFSYTLFFRGDYGLGRLHFPWFTNSVVDDFDEVVLRGGSNDPSNPFVRDELMRRLLADTGQVSSHGTFVQLFLTGLYKGYYNPVERIEKRFCQKWHGGGEAWDVIEQGGQNVDGDHTDFNDMLAYINSHDLSVSGNHLEASRRLDLANFIDYLCVNVYGGTLDWPGNNWRAAREKVPGARWRFYIWDAEGALGGFGQDVFHNTFTSELSGGPEIATLYQRLKSSPEFRLLFADRIQKHFFNKGALTDLSISNRFVELRNTVSGTIPNFDNTILTSWLPQRHGVILGHFAAEGLLASANAPSFNQHGGRVPAGFNFTLTASNGVIYYTTNGADPRVPFSAAAAPAALIYTNGSPVRLDQSTLVRTRSLANGTNWSALVEAEFVIGRLGLPLRITEIMYHPEGGDAFEFIELQNSGTTTLDLSGISLQGVTFLFPQGATLTSAATLVLSSGANSAAFAARYPSVTVFGAYSGSLANSGERLALIDRFGNTIISADYNDANGWPKAADGGGSSIEIIDPNGDPDDPLNWRASAFAGGTPGSVNPPALPTVAEVRLNEIMAHNVSTIASGTNYYDWIELCNVSTQTVILAGWSLTDDGNERKFVFPPDTEIMAGGFLLVWCATNAPGYHTGFSLRREGETVALFDAQTNRVDALTFGLQIADYSIGRMGASWQLNTPTPAATNIAAPLGSITNLVINEWMANPLPGADDWVEIFNKETNRPVALRGLYFGTVTNAVDQIRALSFIAPGGYALFLCDEKPGADHFDLKLPAAGSPLVLYDESGSVLNSVLNGAQTEGVSRGRSPDGSATIAVFTGRATPGGPNASTSYAGPIINEVMSRNATAVTNDAGRVVDWIELFNPRSTNYPMGGMSLSVDVSQPDQWFIPAGVVMPPLSYLAIWCDEETPPSLANGPLLNLGRSLADNSGGIYLFDPSGQLKDAVEYGFQVTNLSLGKIVGNW
ncbi:MAG TPA: lamin tail domain-containing protein, partial [Verrucomicrobiae bacterium]